jgi:hypothetical protein
VDHALSDLVRQVLVKVPAAGDVQHLRAAADAEHRQPPPVGRPDQRQLERVELGLGGPRAGAGGAP